MSAPKIEKGFVGFFDILGYKSFLESSITDVTFKVINILNGLPARNAEEAKKHLGLRDGMVESAKVQGSEDFFDRIRRQLSRVTYLVVSDSILIRCPYDEDRETEKPWQAVMFLLAANILQRVMFDEGLPLRGAIAFGEYVFVDHIFAGKPIIHAHTLGQSLDLAATVLHETAESEFNRLIELNSGTEEFLRGGPKYEIRPLVRHATPVKNKGTPGLLCLNLAWPTISNSLNGVDLREFVHEQFLAHNKRIELTAISKLENTERFLCFLKSWNPILFNRSP